MRNLSLALSPMVFMFASSLAHADGGCETRPTTAKEKATVVRLLQACKNAMPPLPKGWQYDAQSGGETKIEARGDTCKASSTPWRTEYRVSVAKIEGAEERRAQFDKLIKDSAAQMVARQPENEKTFKKIETISMAMAKAAGAGNQAEADRLNAEFAKEKAKLDSQGKVDKEMLAIGEARINKDTFYSVSCVFNRDSVGREPELNDATVAGADVAFRTAPVRLTGATGLAAAVVEVHTLFGKWKREEGPAGSYVAQFDPKREGVTAQTMVLRVVADESRIDSFVASIKTAALAAELNR